MRFKAVVSIIVFALFGGGDLFAGRPSSIPFQFEDGLIWVKVTVAGSILNFVLDSGAGSSVLSLQAARRLGLKLGAPLQVQAVDSLTMAYRVHGFAAKVGEIPINPDLLAMNLQAASAACCHPIEGLQGQDFFRGRIVRIDFKTHRVQLLDTVDVTRSAAVLPIWYHNDIMCIPVGINGLKPKWTRLDTGCDSALEWCANRGKAHGGDKTSIGFTGAGGNCVFADVQIGSARVSAVKTGIHKSPMFPGEAGLLGSGLLSKFCVTVDAKKMRLLLEML